MSDVTPRVRRDHPYTQSEIERLGLEYTSSVDDLVVYRRGRREYIFRKAGDSFRLASKHNVTERGRGSV